MSRTCTEGSHPPAGGLGAGGGPSAPAARGPLLRRFVAPVEKLARIRTHQQTPSHPPSHGSSQLHRAPHPSILKRAVRFDESLRVKFGHSTSWTEKEPSSEHRPQAGGMKEGAEGAERDGGPFSETSAASVRLTKAALEEALHKDERCILACPAIVSCKSREKSWPSVVAVVVNEVTDVEAALFVLVVVEQKDDPLRIRVVLPLGCKSKICMLGSGSLGFRTLITGERESFHLHMLSVQSLWMTLSTIHGLLERAERRKYRPYTELWITDYCSRQEEELGSSCTSLSSPSSSSSSSDDGAIENGGEPHVRRQIIAALKDILHVADLDSLRCEIVYDHLKTTVHADLFPKYKRFVDQKMMMIIGQMEVASEVFDQFLFLGSEWNAASMEELDKYQIDCVLNVTREIPSLYPEQLIYHRIPIWDTPSEDILSWLPDAVDFLIQTRQRGSRCLVHCQRGISRSASVVIAYGMKAHGWTLQESFDHVKGRRNVIKPNEGFWAQLEQYEERLRHRGGINRS